MSHIHFTCMLTYISLACSLKSHLHVHLLLTYISLTSHSIDCHEPSQSITSNQSILDNLYSYLLYAHLCYSHIYRLLRYLLATQIFTRYSDIYLLLTYLLATQIFTCYSHIYWLLTYLLVTHIFTRDFFQVHCHHDCLQILTYSLL